MQNNTDKTIKAEIKWCCRLSHQWLINFDIKRRDIDEQYLDILHGGKQLDSSGGGSSGFVSNVVAAKGVKLAAISREMQWVALIQQVEAELEQEMRMFVVLRRKHRYYTGRQGWIKPVQEELATTMAALTGTLPSEWIKSGPNLTRMWNRLVNDTAIIAAKRGLF